MAAEIISPTDIATGLPLPIIQHGTLPVRAPEVADWHHHFHPSTAPVLTETLGGRALRHSRVQLVDRTHHNEGEKAYHRYFFGPPIPKAESQQFRLSVLACAGYTPEEGIDMAGSEPQVRRMTDIERGRLLTRGRASDFPESEFQSEFGYRNLRYRYEPMRTFFADYAIRQKFDINHAYIDEFLTTRDTMRKQHLGHLILLELSKTAAEPIIDEYRMFKRAGMLHERMPNNPHRIIFHKLGRVPVRAKLIPRLEATLLTAA